MSLKELTLAFKSVESSNSVTAKHLHMSVQLDVRCAKTDVWQGWPQSYWGAGKSLALPPSRYILLMVRIFRLMLVLLYI